VLSNAPGDIVVEGDTRAGVVQGGDWAKESGSAVATRFDYGSRDADAKYVADVDHQARNFINRIAASRWFALNQGLTSARYDARGLGKLLPRFWPACPGSK
jgi:hypothetical protein